MSWVAMLVMIGAVIVAGAAIVANEWKDKLQEMDDDE